MKAAVDHLFCGVMTSGARVEVQYAVMDAWCSRCSQCVFFSNATASGQPVEKLSSGALVVNLQTPGDNGYQRVAYLGYHAEKARRMQLWTAAHAPGFAWYLNADDDTFICMENLLHRNSLETATLAELLQFRMRRCLLVKFLLREVCICVTICDLAENGDAAIRTACQNVPARQVARA